MNKKSCISDPEVLLWKICVNDDVKAFEAFFTLFYPPLLIYAKRYVKEPATCEDIVQDLFTWLWENRGKLTVIRSIRSFLSVSVRNRCLNYLKSGNCTLKHEEVVTMEYAQYFKYDEGIYLLSELYVILEEKLAALPETYRTVFEMSLLEGERYSEIAQKLNISVRTIKRYKKKTIEILRKELK